MTDSTEAVEKKFKKAHCPPTSEENPVLEYCRYIIFEKEESFILKRPEQYGGNMEFSNYEELARAYDNGEIHAADLKTNVAGYINAYLEPIRNHFERNEHAKHLQETVEGFTITR